MRLSFAVALIAAGLAVFAQQPPSIRVDVDLVTVPCSVMDRNGALITDLKIEDFEIKDNDLPRQIKQVWRDVDLPLTIGLIVDVSGSQVGLIGKHRQTMSEFLTRVLSDRDRAFLVTVGTDVRLVTDVTNSVEELRRGIESIDQRQSAGTQLGTPCRGERGGRRHRIARGCGGTALWNGVWAASRLKMKELHGRKALIIVSDGVDTGSKHKLVEAIEAAQGADTMVYAIKYVSPFVAISPVSAILVATMHGMRRLAEETGGEQFPAPKGGPAEIFTQIENELRSQYVLAFSTSDPARDGKYHRISVSVKRPDLKVRARKGYYASGLNAGTVL